MLILYIFLTILTACTKCYQTCGPKGRCDLSRGCPTGWRGFQRPYGRWCLKTFSGMMTASAATVDCSSWNASLSGLQNEEEKWFVIDDLLPQISVATGMIWLGMNRQPMCYSSSNTTLCYPEDRDAFYWTDGSTRGYDMFNWHGTAPQLNNCAMMFVSNSSVEVDTGTAGVWYPGQILDVNCNALTATGSLKSIGYVCGIIPNLYSST